MRKFLLLAILINYSSAASAQKEDDRIKLAVACAGFLSISVSNTQDPIAVDIATSAAKWYADRAKELVAVEFSRFSNQELKELGLGSIDELANVMIGLGLKSIQSAYNDGTFSWTDITDAAKNCLAEKIAFESL